MNDDLNKLGDALERAVARDVANTASAGNFTPTRSHRFTHRAAAGVAIGGLALLGVGVAAAVAVLDEDEVAAGLPGGAVHFIGTDPSCTATDDPDVFGCVLARAPLYDFVGRPIDPSTPPLPLVTLPPDWTAPDTTEPPPSYPATGGPEGTEQVLVDEDPEPTDAPPDPNFDWTDSLFPFVDDDHLVAGVCRGDDSEGIQWTCFAGQRAVDEGLMSAEGLGVYQPGPGVG